MADGDEINEHIPQGLVFLTLKCKITKAFTKLTDHLLTSLSLKTMSFLIGKVRTFVHD